MNTHPSFETDLDHVFRPAAARKGDDDLWFAGPQHFPVADRPGPQPVHLPVSSHRLAGHPASLSPFACEPVCPVEAIYYEDDVPEEYTAYTDANAEFFNGIPDSDLGGAAKHGPFDKDVPLVAALPPQEHDE